VRSGKGFVRTVRWGGWGWGWVGVGDSSQPHVAQQLTDGYIFFFSLLVGTLALLPLGWGKRT
jgi:hypothetical protein